MLPASQLYSTIGHIAFSLRACCSSSYGPVVLIAGFVLICSNFAQSIFIRRKSGSESTCGRNTKLQIALTRQVGLHGQVITVLPGKCCRTPPGRARVTTSLSTRNPGPNQYPRLSLSHWYDSPHESPLRATQGIASRIIVKVPVPSQLAGSPARAGSKGKRTLIEMNL